MTERKQAEAALNRRDAILAALAFASQRLLASDSLADVLPAVLARLGQAVAASRAYIFENRETADGRLLSSQRHEWTGPGQVSQLNNPNLQDADYEAAGYGRWLALFRRGQPIFGTLDSFPIDERWLLNEQAIKSLAVVPVFSGDLCWGFLGFDDCVQAREWSPVELEALQSAAGVLGAVIENRRLYEVERTARARAEVMREIAHIVSASLDRDEVLRKSFAQLRRVLVFDTASVYLQGEGIQPVLVAGSGYEDHELVARASADLLPTSPILSRMALDLRPVVSPDVRELPGWLWVPGAEHVRSFLAVPLVVRETWIGALMVDSREPSYFTPTDVQLCQDVSQSIAFAVENARLFQTARQRLSEQSALVAASTAISSSLDLQTVLGHLAEQMAKALGVTSVYICDWKEQAGTSTVLVEYFAPEAAEAERVSDLGFTYDLRRDFGDDLEWIATGTPIVRHADAPALPDRWRSHLSRYGGKSNLAVPLIIKKAVIGYAELWESRFRRDFTAEEIALCQAIAQQAAIAFENARLFEAERHQLRLAQTLQAVGALLTSSLELQEVFEQIFVLLAEVVKYDTVSVQVPNEQGELVLVAGRGYQDLNRARLHTQTLGRQILNRDWQGQRAFVVTDTAREASWLQTESTEHIRSWVGAALLVKGRFIGILNVNSYLANAYDSLIGVTVEAFANQAAVAIENARLFEQSQRHTQELAGLYATTVAITGVLEPEVLLNRLYEQVQLLIAPDSFLAVVYHAESDELEIALAMELGNPLPGLVRGLRLPSEQGGLTGWIARHQQPLLIADMEKETLPVAPRHGRRPARSWLGIPLLAGGRVTGVVSVQSFAPDAFGPSDRRFLESVAGQVAIALDNARLFQSEAQRRREAETLNQLSAYLSSTLDLHEVLERAVEAVRRHLTGIHSCSISILEDNGRLLSTRVSWWAGERYQLLDAQAPVPVEDTVASRQALTTRRPVIISDLSGHEFDPQPSARMKQDHLRSLLYVPILIHGQGVGLLHVNVWNQPRYFLAAEVALCQGVANQTAIAIENAQLFEAERRQLRLSQTLQQVGALLTARLSMEEVYEQVFDLLAQVVTFNSVSVQLLGENGQAYLAAGRGFPDIDLVRRFISSISAHSLRKLSPGTPVRVVPDTWNDADWLRHGELEHIRSWIGAALVVKGRMIGILNVDSASANTFDSATGDTVAAFANQAAVAIENARLYEETRQRAAELAVLHHVAVATAAVLDMDQMLELAVEAVSEALYPDIFGFVLYDAARDELRPHLSFHGVSREAIDSIIPLDRSVTGQVLRSGQARIIADVRHEPLYMELDETIRSEIAVPIRLGDEVIGVINAESPKVAAFSDNDLRFLTTLAGQVATVVQRADLYATLRQQAQNLAEEVALRTAELRAERDRTQAVLDSAGEGIFFTDPQGILKYTNAAMTNLIGYSAGEALGQTPALWLLQPSTEGSREMWRAVAAGRSWSGDLVNRRKDGVTFDANVTIAPIHDSDGLVTGFVGIQSDISRLKEVDRLKSEFIANVSHELRTPLTNIKTYLTLMERGRQERYPHYMNVLSHETERLTQLIQDLLDVSRLDSRDLPLALEAVDLYQLAWQIHTSFIARAENKRIYLEVQIPDDLPLVRAEPRQLDQVFTNLVGNAIAYTPEGGAVSLTAGQDEFDGRLMAWVKVADTGPGIAPDDLTRIFERFYRGQVAQESGVPGTGLGLAISQEIIARHGGLIEVASNVGQGTTFTIWLKIAG